MKPEHEVFSDEYMSSTTKRYKQGELLFTVLTLTFTLLAALVTLLAVVIDRTLVARGADMAILGFVSAAIAVIARARRETLVENKRLWDRTGVK